MDDDPELAAIRAKLQAQLMADRAASATGGLPVDVDDAAFVPFVTAHRLVLVDVWAPWCGPCHIIAPTVEAIARDMAGRVAVAKVNADENPGVMGAFGIQSIPTLLLFRDGRLLDRVTGALPPPQLKAWVGRHVAPP